MEYELKAARTVLSDTEKDRLVCLYLTIDPSQVNSLVDWDKAADALGNASVDSLRVSTRNTLKKIKVGNVSADVLNGTATPAKPKATPKKRKSKGGDDVADGGETTTPKKRKSKGGEENADGGETTTPKKRGRKAKAVVAAEDNDEEEPTNGNGEMTVDQEVKREESDESEEP